MADKIEEKALALLKAAGGAYHLALVNAIEAHEADKQAFSDAVEALDKSATPEAAVKASRDLCRFIIKKPDPLVEVIKAAWPNASEHFGEGHTEETAEQLRQALAARGLKIVEAAE